MPRDGDGDDVDDLISILPLRLAPPQLVPPAPTRRASAMDFLYDFGGQSWIAYGAAHLLVVSHVPSPNPRHEVAAVGPFFRQVIEQPVADDEALADVMAVSWCPALPSEGTVAAAWGNCVRIFGPTADNVSGSFCWRQIEDILQSFIIEAVGWTRLGDGLIVAGIEVVFWIRKGARWEVLWRSMADVPQTLISASWLTENLVASAAGISSQAIPTQFKADSSSVLVHLDNGKSGITKVLLCHPQPVSMIQWRLPIVKDMPNDGSNTQRDVLLTSCFDGTVRLWSEVDNGRNRKTGKDLHGQKHFQSSFHVIAIIEMDQCLKGTLGVDTSIAWALGHGGVISNSEEDSCVQLKEYKKHGEIGQCEWLISVGPGSLISFWAIHCLDDMSPLRFPRITLWEKLDLRNFKEHNPDNYNFSYPGGGSVLVKVIAFRNWLYGPPFVCSLLQLLTNNSLCWLKLYNPSDFDGVSSSPGSQNIVCAALSYDGHTGEILQIAVHPYSCDIKVAVSLDSEGFLLLWSLPISYSCPLDMQMHIHPTWKLLGRVFLKDISHDNEYSCLKWAPSVLNKKFFLLLGHQDGIDCFALDCGLEQRSITCKKILVVPFSAHIHVGGSPDLISAAPNSSIGGLACNSFLLFAIWIRKFQALSWKVCLHSEDPCRSGESFATADMISSAFPESLDTCQVTSVCVVSPDNSVLPLKQCLDCHDAELLISFFPFQLITGFSDGTLRLWRESHSNLITNDGLDLCWELVGTFTAHEGPVRAISVSMYCGKIATVALDSRNNLTSLHIWKSIYLIDSGCFLLEDAISLSKTVIALSWFSVGNGQLLLGVCMQNELRVYSERRYTDHDPVKSNSSMETHSWFCIVSSPLSSPSPRDFFWCPSAAPLVLYSNHFSFFSPWLLQAQKEHFEDQHVTFVDGANYGSRSSPLLTGSSESPSNEISKENNCGIGTCHVKNGVEQYLLDSKSGLYGVLDVADRLRSSLEIYHPKALMHYLYKGNWKRMFLVLRHLVGYLESACTSTDMKYKYSKSNGIPEMHLSVYFDENISKDLFNNEFEGGQYDAKGSSNLQYQRNTHQFQENNSVPRALDHASNISSHKSEIMGFLAVLDKCGNIAHLKDIDKAEISSIVELLGEISDSHYAATYGSLDEPGRRFWVSVRFQHLYFYRKFGRLAAAEELIANSELVAWAFQSDCQDDLFISIFSAEPSWLEMRNMGVGYWFTNTTQLRSKMEKLARSQYLKRKDPKDCALLYLALNRVQVLAGLFKLSRDEKDKLLCGFLSRNFQEEKNKAAALKNAYVLMGRHQWELAISFFLLGGDLSSAVTVCAKNFGEEQLALVICLLLEGYGGPIAHQLISNFLLPNAIDKGDYWLSSILEWMLGNYSRSLELLVSSSTEPVIGGQYAALCGRAIFSEPSIGQHCIILASKNPLKNVIGDFLASVVSKFASFMASEALNGCGLHIEALELFAFMKDSKEQCSSFNLSKNGIFDDLLHPFHSGDCNWLLGRVAFHLELNTKTTMCLSYLAKYLSYHPFSLSSSFETFEDSSSYYENLSCEKNQIENFNSDMSMVVTTFEHKYQLKAVDLAEMILVFANNKGLHFLCYQWLRAHIRQEVKLNSLDVDDYILNSVFSSLLLKMGEEIPHILARYVASCSFNDSALRENFGLNSQGEKDCCNSGDFYLANTLHSLLTISQALNFYGVFHYQENTSWRSFDALLFLQYVAYFVLSWLTMDLKRLIFFILPILRSSISDKSTFEFTTENFLRILYGRSDLVANDALGNVTCELPDGERGMMFFSIPGDEKWFLVGVSLWVHLSRYTEQLSNKFLLPCNVYKSGRELDLSNVFRVIISSIVGSSTYILSSLTEQLVSYLRKKTVKGLPVPTLNWLNESDLPLQSDLDAASHDLGFPTNGDRKLLLKTLWEITVCPSQFRGIFLDGKCNYLSCNSHVLTATWYDIQKAMLTGYGDNIFSSKTEETFRKDAGEHKDFISFQSPKEVFKRSGELIEAICFNSTNEYQVALLSNRKGLLFFDLKNKEIIREDSAYIWSGADWPQEGWAGCQSTPVPTFVSPGIGLGSKRGAHLGLGGGTVGLRSLARPGKDLTGGGAFGIPGYAGIGASGLGWGEQEEFEDFVDPPATIENIRSRALSRHPSRPFFLVGSSNTHIYLWEFGNDKAAATYGVLPAANVPPPYALASVSALTFDRCGQRFASAALDGTVCSWQLEVGGRSNVQPTDSTLCFNHHASDITYLSSSGSILAAAGYSLNGANVVVWDTLAPPGTSQASLICHEGGARSLSVFDSDIGSGSVSPLIVTGGKNGDVGLHDFRFIATGKTKLNRHSGNFELKSGGIVEKASAIKSGENMNGMIWYIPEAHLGSITKISTIPNTCLFLTGSKSGDVKLWDAKACRLVFHWQKLHERHTFIQPSSRGFGGVVRAAVTDIQVLSRGFLTCGGDGSVKIIYLT